MKYLLYLVTLSLLLVSVFGDEASTFEYTVEGADRTKRLIGSKDTMIWLHSYFVSLEENNFPMCGGAIISRLYVLTAAHCARDRLSTLLVRAGSDQYRRGGSLHQILTFATHPKFYVNETRGIFNDIGVIRVRTPFEFDLTRQPIAMFEPGERVHANSLATIVGFGLISPNMVPAMLQKIFVPVVEKSHCEENYSQVARASGFELKNLPPGTFCAGYDQGGVDTCTGDSGSPVVIGGRLAGVVSNGIGCGMPQAPGLNTEVPYFRYWIDDRIGF